MKFTHDNYGNKLITIPPINADENAEDYKHLHTKSLVDLDLSEELSDIYIKPNEKAPTHLIIEYKDLLKPNVIFMFSKGLQDRVATGEPIDFLLDCQFFFYKDSNDVGHIRFARPIEFDNEVSLIFN